MVYFILMTINGKVKEFANLEIISNISLEENIYRLIKEDLVPNSLQFLKRDSKKGVLLEGSSLAVAMLEEIFMEEEDFSQRKFLIERKKPDKKYDSSQWYLIEANKYCF